VTTPTDISARTLVVLRSTFGYPAFRGNQAAVIDHVAAGHSAFVLMPTGGGKSLCYQIPALVRDGLTVVISPLIALMQDQVAALQRRGVRAELLNSTLSARETARIEQDIRAGHVKLLYVSPERLLTARTMALLGSVKLALFAVDEAHCIAEWGHDFRPHYLGLSVLAERFAHVPRIALTATADAETQADIIRRLGLADARRFGASFDRPNIQFTVVPKRDPHQQLLRFIRTRHAGAVGVVYCQSRARVEATAAFLDAHGIAALPYHAGLTTRQRDENQQWFLSRPGVVMVATIAFGMGIDKPDVRFVAHIDVPVSIEGYYQEMGRAGRDGLPSEAWLTYDVHDATGLVRRIKQSDATPERQRVRLHKLDAMLALCETAACRRATLLGYFDETVAPCGTCDNCVSPPPTIDGAPLLRRIVEASAAQPRTAHELATALAEQDSARPRWQRWRDTRGVDAWRAVIRQCVALRALGVDHRQGSCIVPTAASGEVSAGQRPLRLPGRRTTRAPQTKARGAPARAAADTAEVRDQLYQWRERTARARGVPDHIICHDAALDLLAAKRPRSRFALRWIAGIGPRRAALYGAGILATLAARRPQE
jgi:ATP-dependent DNA helicase RecQ